jgi:DNA-binding transcriptional regulator YbjK
VVGRVRGAGRRAALLDATIGLIGRQGLGAVTHRSVAAAAGVPAATTGYYFTSREQLVDEALALLAEREVAALRERHALVGAEPTVDAVAAALTTWLLEHAGATGAAAIAALAQQQLQVEAARRPEVAGRRAAAKGQIDALAEATLRALGAAEPAAAAVLLVAAVDGLQLRLLTQTPDETDPMALEATVRVLLLALTTHDPACLTP